METTKNNTRILLGFFLPCLLIPVFLMAVHFWMEPSLSPLGAGWLNLFILYQVLFALTLPLLFVLMIVHFLYRHFSLCYWWIYSVGVAAVFATVMWPLLGLGVPIPIVGAVAGILFYVIAIFPHSGNGPEVEDAGKLMIKASLYACLLTSVYFIYVKLYLMEIHFNNGDLGVAIKSQASLQSYAKQEQISLETVFLTLSKDVYYAKPYFDFIVSIGWYLFPVLSVVLLGGYFYYNRRNLKLKCPRSPE